MKLPDPELFDGDWTKYDAWSSKVLEKLDVNADHFLTEWAKLAYVHNWTTGCTEVQIAP